MTQVKKDKVIFLRGTRADYESLQTKDPNTIYFILDTNEIYVGEELFSTIDYNELINLPDLTNYVQKDGDKVLSDNNFSQKWIDIINGKQNTLTADQIKQMIKLSDYITTTAADSKYQPKGTYLTKETDPTVPAHVKSITTEDIENWNKGKTYTEGDGINISEENEISVDMNTVATKEDLEGKQDTLTFSGGLQEKDGNVNTKIIYINESNATLHEWWYDYNIQNPSSSQLDGIRLYVSELNNLCVSFNDETPQTRLMIQKGDFFQLSPNEIIYYTYKGIFKENFLVYRGTIKVIPSKTSEIENNSGFITINDTNLKYQPIGNYATEEWVENQGYTKDITQEDINNWNNKIKAISIDNTEFIPSGGQVNIPLGDGLQLSSGGGENKLSINNNYLSQNYATKEELVKLNRFEIAQSDEQGYPDIENPDGTKIYLVLRETSDIDNIYNEFIWVKKIIEGEEIEAWEFLGNTEIDITGLVKDVQVNETSITQDGVANIPIAGDTNLGLVQVNPVYGVGFISSQNPQLKTIPATNSQIDNRYNYGSVIAATNLDYAVKAAMCDGKGAAWTSEEQAAAKERLGVIEIAKQIQIGGETPTDENIVLWYDESDAGFVIQYPDGDNIKYGTEVINNE